MSAWAYYNENEPFAAAWLRNLIAARLIPDGEVDERSIVDVRPSDLDGFRACHFFAGIGGWPYALRLAGWPDDRPIWTGSCPCQPFSVAGAGEGTNDARHLWPAFNRLIAACRPPIVIGEQVSSPLVHGSSNAGDVDLQGMWAREELIRLSHSRIAPEISRYLQGLSERAGAQASREDTNSHERAADALAFGEQGLGPRIFGEASIPREGMGVRSRRGVGSIPDRFGKVRTDGNPSRFDGRLERPIDRQDRSFGGLFEDELSGRHSRYQRDDEPVGTREGLGDCGRDAPQDGDQREERCLIAFFGGEPEKTDRSAWLDLVATDLEGKGYAFGTAVFPAAGVGSPQIRHRTYWLAGAMRAGRTEWRPESGRRQAAGVGELSRLGNTGGAGLEGRELRGGECRDQRPIGAPVSSSRLAGADEGQRGRLASGEGCERDGGAGRWRQGDGGAPGDCEIGGMGSATNGDDGSGPTWRRGNGPSYDSSALRPGPVNGFWRASDWLYCRDERWRPVSPFPQQMAPGIPEDLGRISPEIISQIEEEISASGMEGTLRDREVLRDLWRSLRAQATCGWESNRLPRLCEAPFLLAFLLRLSKQGRSISSSAQVSCPQTDRSGMRGVWDDAGQAGASCQWGLDGQPPREHPNALSFLSSLLAFYAEKAWGDAYAAYAEATFPLARNAKSRVGRLRGYGNAVCIPQAVAFVRAAMECLA